MDLFNLRLQYFSRVIRTIRQHKLKPKEQKYIVGQKLLLLSLLALLYLVSACGLLSADSELQSEKQTKAEAAESL